MNKRREFIKGAGIIGGLAAAFVGTKVVINEKEKSNKETIAEIEKLSTSVITFRQQYGELDTSPQSPLIINSGPRFKPGTVKTETVKLIPGPDGELYIHTNGEWKKVITT